jgi:hypothetical protein
MDGSPTNTTVVIAPENASAPDELPDYNAIHAELEGKIKQVAKGDANRALAMAEKLVASPLPLSLLRGLSDALAKQTGADKAQLWNEIKHARIKHEQAVRAAADDDSANEPSPYFLENPEPISPEQLTFLLAWVLDQIVKVIQRRVVCPVESAWAVALWVACTWGVRPPGAPGGPYIFPRLLIWAATARAGKSTLLETVMALSRSPMMASNISVAALFRSISAFFPTLGLDEADISLRNNPELISVMNGGHMRNGSVLRTQEVQARDANGGMTKDHKPRAYSSWCPMAIAGIGRQAFTTEDRSIRISLQRQPAALLGDPMDFEKLRATREHIASALGGYADAMADAMAQCSPPVAFPPWVGSRDRDNWRPLIHVADLAGGAWPDRVRKAMEALCADAADRRSAPEQLLADIRAYVREHRLAAAEGLLRRWADAKLKAAGLPPHTPPQRHALAGGTPGKLSHPAMPLGFIRSADLAAWLMDKDDSPVARERDVNAAKLKIATMLRGFGIRPGQRGEGRGYPMAPLKQAWRRYL